MRLATLTIHLSGNWIGVFSNRTGMRVKIQRCIPKTGTKGRSLLRIEGPESTSQEDLERELDSFAMDCSIDLTCVSPGNWIGTAEVRDCRLCCALSNSDCILESARSLEDGVVEWVVVAPDGAALTGLIKDLESMGCEVKTKRITQLKDSRELTKHQRRALRLAYELGYYDIPKRVNLEKLAERMEISKAALDTILRRAQRKLIEERMSSL
jgi:predicted DNA binding protein